MMQNVIRDLMERFVKEPVATPQMLAQMDGMAERNAKRIEAIKKEMGEKYILHPSHAKQRLDSPRPV